MYKSRQAGFLIIELVLIVLVVSAAAGTGWYVYKNQQAKHQNQTKTAETATQTAKPPVQEPPKSSKVAGVTVQANDFVALTLNNGNQYFGKVTPINDQFLRLAPVFYKNGSVLTQLGNELHAPEPAIYIEAAKVTAISQLKSDDSIYKAAQALPTTTFSDAFPKTDIDSYIKSGQYQAAFFADGTTLFGKLENLQNLFGTNRVFMMRSTATQTSLILAPSATVSTETADKLLFWENLRSDGRVTQAIEAYTKAN